jgi:hypothetical protein
MHTGTMTRDTVAKAAANLISGVCADTTIMTLDGEMRVEDLTQGTRVLTRDSGMAALRTITSQTVRVAPIRINAGSLDHTRPDRDMLVAPGTQIHIRNWRAEALFCSPAAMVDAQRLVDGECLAVQDMCEMTVFTLTFDRKHIMYADGIEMASASA